MTFRIKDLRSYSFIGFASLAITFLGGSAEADLLAHYRFDLETEGLTPDALGANSATLGNRVQINTSVDGRIGNGALEMLGSGVTVGPGDGAVTSNSFSWENDARTVIFWWRANSPNVNATEGTFVSFGSGEGSGTRFDIKEQGATNLRVEIQGIGVNSSPPIDDGEWHFIAVTVPNNATFADVAFYTDGAFDPATDDLNTSLNPLEVATGTGPMAFGDSILTVGSNTRVPNGFLDDVQVYDTLLTPAELTFLYNNPGSTLGGPASGPPAISSIQPLGGDVYEVVLTGAASSTYQFRSSTTLDFSPGTLVTGLAQGDPADPGMIEDGNTGVVTTDSLGNAKVQMTLTGNPKDFIIAVSLP